MTTFLPHKIPTIFFQYFNHCLGFQFLHISSLRTFAKIVFLLTNQKCFFFKIKNFNILLSIVKRQYFLFLTLFNTNVNEIKKIMLMFIKNSHTDFRLRTPTFHFQLSLGVRQSRRAFRSIFARSVITSLAKDAAPIPNASSYYKNSES